MMNRRFTMTIRILLLLYIVTVAYLCFGHFSDMPEVKPSFWNIEADKIVHFLMFTPFPFLTYFSIGKKAGSVLSVTALLIGIFITGCLIAMGTELGQSLTDYRSGDPLDFRADMYGLILGTVVTFFAALFVQKGKER